MIILDGTIVNVALPSIQSDLGFTQSSLAWVVNAYLIAFGGLLLLAGRLGDLIGRKRLVVIGLAVFTGASLVCGLSGSPEMLIAARFVQGVGGALSSAVALGMIVTMFPDAREQARAFGVYSFVASAGASIGLLAGGILTQAISWHWIFFVNGPIGIAAAVLSARLLQTDRGVGLGKGADVAGAILVTAALMLGVYTIVETTQYGWTSLHTLGFGAVSVVLLAGFIARQATASNPLLPLRIFRSRDVSGANLIQFLLIAGMLGFFFLSSLYLRRVVGLDPLHIGLAFLPVAVSIGVLSLGWSARLTMRFGARRLLTPALITIAVGLGLLMRLPVHSTYAIDLLPGMLLLGVGAGLTFPALATLAMSGATESDSGLASGLLNTTAQVGGALGLAVMATVAASKTESLLAAGQSLPNALTGGFRLVFGISAALIVAGIVLALTWLRESESERSSASEELEAGDEDAA
ncbi:MAG: DHA2 family efflux MFS transporter permease subunit [Chloroflexi bacterium]|nr:MAG: DHA2 family efflux MFS transporter permease subunit [Chloroflexota bacterium]TME54365.1 MAG: DHA2 family efflux MFS transporter permease subunit [Chloroflexota bacterium]